MAAANREERRLMRQRGAGTRQIQEVDFGFSFGTPVAQPAQQQPPQPEQSNVASGGSLLGDDPTPETQKQLPPPPPPPQSARRGSQTKLHTPTARRSSVRRSPTSSRNGHTSSSVYDIPPDPPQNLSSGAKRRRIGPGPQDGPISTTPGSWPRQTNGIGLHEGQITGNTEQAQPSQEATDPPVRRTTRSPPNEPSSSLPSVPEDGSDLAQQKQTPPTNNVQNGVTAHDSQQSVAESSSKPHTGKPRKKPRKRKSIIWSRKPRRSSDEANKRRNEAAQAEQAHEPEPEPETQPEPEQDPESEPELPEQPKRSPARKKQRKSKSVVQQPEEQETVSAEAEEVEGSYVAEEVTEQSEAAAKIPEKKGPKRKKRQSVLPKKRKPKAPSSLSVEQQPEDENEGNEEADSLTQENADESAPEEPEPEPEPLPRSRNKRKSTAQGPRRTRRSLETVQEEPEAQSENEDREAIPQQAPPRKKQRKPRQANSETGSKKGSFPVTVHRLTNVAALDAISESDRSSHEPDSSDELATRTKFPNRGGVNPADVLSQICRETLEKTLSALENGIENESQPARRAEFTRKRKAVEAFSAELEGRLFDMSEVLESNFALAMGLRRAKKEMVESRSKLMDIRRQREEIALKTDEVRRKHSEEERMQTQHNTVNNSLHNLELAIDRDQRHAESVDKNNPAAGIEFLLRSVADDVSSTAPGSQGGLLNQVKNFNSRLEEYAKGGGARR